MRNRAVATGMHQGDQLDAIRGVIASTSTRTQCRTIRLYDRARTCENGGVYDIPSGTVYVDVQL